MPIDSHSGSAQNPPTMAFIWLRRHALIYFSVLAALLLIYYFSAGQSWFFWLAMAWGAALLIHFFIVKSLTADEDWADQRAEDLRFNSYDHKHMNSIRGRYIKPRAQRRRRSVRSED